MLQQFMRDESEMLAFGEKLASCITQGGWIYLEGNLGVGKTTLTRGLLRGLGYKGAVKSPTFSIVEPYEIDHQRVYHFDLYRLGDPDELEYLGIRDYFSEDVISIVEWPDKGMGVLPASDLLIEIEYQNSGRKLTVSACTDRGQAIVEQL